MEKDPILMSADPVDVGRSSVPSDSDVLETRSDFADFYQARFDGSVRLARHLTGSWDVARDVTQDAFCGLYRRWNRVDDPEAYLRRSITNGATSHYRRRARDQRRPKPRVEVAQLGAAELTDALHALPARQRSALVLRFYLDLPDAEVAEALGVRVGTVASLVHRGLAALNAAISAPSTTSVAQESGAPK